MGISDNDAVLAKSMNLVSSGSSPKYKQRRVSGSRDYPPGCGPQIDSIPGKFEVSSFNGTDSAGTRIQSRHLTASSIMDKKLDDVGVLNVKYPPKRRMAGVRDFPLNCGRNALISKGEEQEKEPMMNAGYHKQRFGSGIPVSRRFKVAGRKNLAKFSERNGLKVAAEKATVLIDGSERSNNRLQVSAFEQRKPLAKNKATSKTDEPMNQEAEWNGLDDDKFNGSLAARRRIDSSMNLVPSGPSSSKGCDIDRKKVKELLREFHKIRRESKAKHIRRADCFASKELKRREMCLNQGKSIVGALPGVEVGDEFPYRFELHLIGLHRPPVDGIDFVKQGNITIAVSVVASGGYGDDLGDSDFLEYTGQGGRQTRTKEAVDQKLEAGNLALKNSIEVKNPVRVIREVEKMSDSADGKGTVYAYDGLYTVESYWPEQGPNGKLVYKFYMVRIPGQPNLAWKQVRRSKKGEAANACASSSSFLNLN